MNSSALGQYYTDQKIGELIANNFLSESPSTLLELGVGKGSLMRAVKNRWNEITVISADIDPKNHSSVQQSFPQGYHYCHNAVDEDLPARIGLGELSIDIAVCNPPYISLSLDEKIESILYKSGFGSAFSNNSNIAADLVFLAQNLRFLKNGGELGIILPDSYLSGHKYEWVRDILIKEHCISCIIDLPEKVFKKTEAKTHILILEKGTANKECIPILKTNRKFKIEDKVLIEVKDAVFRMDYTYHKWKASTSYNKGEKKLQDIEADIKRGSLSKKDCIEKEIEYFHTTDFKKCPENGYVSLDRKVSPIGNAVIAKEGDILLARVGKRCIGKVALVVKGSTIISDCVYRIRVPKRYRKALFRSLRGAKGKSWIVAHSHGVCSKVLSKRNLLNYKIK